MAWGMRTDILPVADVLLSAQRSGIILLASASNQGANSGITFPARLNYVFCIGSADGKGGTSSFNPPFIGEEKYSSLGEEVLGACHFHDDDRLENLYNRRSGTSTAVYTAAGIAALLIDYTRQFMDLQCGADRHNNMRKIFIKMSEATAETTYRFLSPKYLFELSTDTKHLIRSVISKPSGNVLVVQGLISQRLTSDGSRGPVN